jgi:hypothetical protein
LTNEEYLQLASLWTTPPPLAEREALARLARRTPRIARWVQYGELGVVLLLAAAIGAAVVWRLGADTLLLGSLILLLLAWSAWKRHRLADQALLIDRSDRFSYLSSLVRAKEAELTRSAIGLALILPGTLLATILAHVVYVDAPVQRGSCPSSSCSAPCCCSPCRICAWSRSWSGSGACARIISRSSAGRLDRGFEPRRTASRR